jgi:DNA replication protein DnaC
MFARLMAAMRTLSYARERKQFHQLMEARDERRLLKLQSQLTTVKLPIIDEQGYVPLSQTGAELLF